MAERLISRLASPLLAPPPPRPPAPVIAHPPAHEHAATSPLALVSRRAASWSLLSLAAVLPTVVPAWSPQASAAFPLGISGPKEWLQNQKKKAARFVLAPIDASRRSLQAAYLLLSADSKAQIENAGEVRRLLNAASRDCVVEDRGSIAAFQARTGVEVCTFRLVLNNVSSLLDDNDPKKLEAEKKLDELVRSFVVLGRVVDNGNLQLESDRQKAKDGLNDTIFALGKFEESIKSCLGF